MNSRFLSAISAIVFLFGLAYLLVQASVLPLGEVTSATTDTPSSPVVAPTTVSQPLQLTFVGDIMLDRTVWKRIIKHGTDYPFKKMKDLLQKADIAVANFENPMTDRGTHARPYGPLLFKAEPKLAAIVAASGLDAVSLANNHTFNQGKIGLADTRRLLEAAGVAPFGGPRDVRNDEVKVIEKNGRTIALIGWNIIETADPKKASLMDLIRTHHLARETVIVMPHWGGEYKPQTKQQITLAHAMVDAGADMIIGAHPHVVQGIEVYNNRPIVYSLGNFIFDQDWSIPTQQGLAVQVALRDNQLVLQFVPIDIAQSQPRIASKPIAKTILMRIANASDPALKNRILAGQITLDE